LAIYTDYIYGVYIELRSYWP